MRAYMIALVLVLMGSGSVVPAQSPSQAESKAELNPEEIIKKFSEKEMEYFEAWKQYTYTQTAVIRIKSVDGAPTNESMMLVSEVVFNDDGSREVKLVDRRGRILNVGYTPEDEEIINNLNPFALTSKDLPLYNVKYQGKERVDELDCYVFSVDPRNVPDYAEAVKESRFYFKGKIWVDDRDLQIVRTVGRAVPQDKNNKFPEFETLRQIIDGKYWFPVYTHADEKLVFPDKTVRIEETITYEGYKEFGSRTKIKFGTALPSADPE